MRVFERLLHSVKGASLHQLPAQLVGGTSLEPHGHDSQFRNIVWPLLLKLGVEFDVLLTEAELGHCLVEITTFEDCTFHAPVCLFGLRSR